MYIYDLALLKIEDANHFWLRVRCQYIHSFILAEYIEKLKRRRGRGAVEWKYLFFQTKS